ncbi:uncharacterized protein PgNI_02750 [Pyricularia grisea]|uniref:Ankyrin repeat protein n=1 Tax=Pyricularia grisea TaxID=148305 RepID=A0A6P8BCN3_PYRGI|nr:uncharacterized protein PgNI_02750 [Pyricularia grisea]TLD13631.1 hypothetical protein PgNI_02750 [Pyricularia grisea]
MLVFELGHKEIVQILIDSGADVNAQGGEYGNHLQASSYKGCKEIVKILVDNGAMPKVAEIVQTLVDNGVDVNAQGSEYGNALAAAAFRGHTGLAVLAFDIKHM